MGNQFKNVAVIACLKTFLFIFNILFWLSGILLLIVGLWAEFDLYKYMQLSSEFSGTAPHAMIGIAALIVLVSSVAFSCIIKGQPVLLYIYGGFLACIFMMDAGVGASVACYRDTFSKGLYDGLTQTLVSSDRHRGNFDLAQATLHCCGVSNYTDWVRVQRSIPLSCCVSPDDCVTANYSHVYQTLHCCGVSNYTDWVRVQRSIPLSCCVSPDDCVTANYSHVYQTGCYKVIVEYLESNMDILIGIAIGTALFPLVGTVLSCCLASYIKKSKYDAMN